MDDEDALPPRVLRSRLAKEANALVGAQSQAPLGSHRSHRNDSAESPPALIS